LTTNAPDPPLVPPGPPAPAEGEQLVPVFVTVAVRTSAPEGAGPGVRHVPAAEASALVGAKLAVPGDRPPRGWPG
jgi:hypothetical protein